MRTQRISRYLTAMIIALGTSFNVFAQQRNLKIYFNEYADGETSPRMYVTDDHPNGEYDVPLGVTVSPEGVAWAGKSRFFEWITTDVTDRVMADYVKGSNGQVDKKNSHLKLTFTNFPYEVNVIQWNVMNDLLSGSLTNWFKNYGVTTKCTPVSDNGFSYTEEHWSLNIFTHSTTFNQGDIPWQSGATLNGLESFEISENYETKIGIGGWTWIDLGQSELNDKNRTFIKARWNGSDTNPKVKDDDGNLINIEEDDNNWAFKVKFTLPDIRMRSYAYDKATGAIGQQDNLIYQGEKKVHALQGYISAHAGAVEPTYDPTDQSDFHFEYFADASQMSIQRYSGVILDAKVAGDIPVTVVLMRGRDREVCRYTQTISVSEKLELSQKAEICIGFVDGKKGYDLTLTEKNAQIKGFITNPAKDKNGQNVNLSITENASLCHFEYSESSEGEIITIDPLTGDITPKKEGDVQITAILKYGNNIYSDPFTYTLHVYGKAEGVDVNKHQGLNTPAELINATEWHLLTGTIDVNPNNWKASETNQSGYQPYDWQHNSYLRPSTSILENSSNQSGAGQDGWKEIAWYKTSSANYWRGIAQKICFDIRLPKYSTVDANLSFAGNMNTGTGKGTNCQYGFEVINLGNLENTDVTKTNNRFNDITWNTTTTGENVKSTTYTSLAQKAIKSNGGYVGDGSNVESSENWAFNDITQSNFGTNRYYTHYLGVMAYIYRDGSYPGEFSVGYKGNLTYTYYTSITYYKNDGTSTVIRNKKDYPTTSKTETVKLFQNASTNEKNLLKREGYTFIGWSTDPNATTAEYEFQGDFLLYDDVEGGGRGPVNLYAVWQPNNYIVTLHKNDGGNDETVTVTATYGEPMPEDIGLVAPSRKGYDFTGFRTQKDIKPRVFYYDAEMKSAHIYDHADDYDLYADWVAHKTRVVFDLQGGILYYGATEVTATYGKNMPTVGLNQGESQNVGAPQRQGYTFGGYYSKENGAGTQYYTASMASARTWNIDERTLNPQVEYVTLYAKWIPNTYTVTLDHNDGTGVTEQITVAYEQDMPEISLPTRSGYEFDGYWDNQTNGQGKQYYKANGSSASIWDKMDGGTIYAHWTPKTYIVTFDAGSATLPQGIIDGNKDLAIEQASDGIIKIRFTYGVSVNNIIDNSKPKKPAYNLLGFYDENDVLVATVSVDDPDDRHIHLTGAGNYWEQNGTNVKWVHTGDLTLTAKYERKFTVVDGNIIKFGSEAKVEYVEPKHDWLMQVVNDLIGAAQEVGSKENPVMVFDMTDSKNIWTGGGYNCQEVMESLQASEYSDIISPNVLVYFNEGSYNNKNYETNKFASNAITADNKCLNLYVTDRYQMKIPYAFNAAKATYERNKVQKDNNDLDDEMWKQSHNSVWGTLCLPYPITNNNTHKVSDDIDCKVIFYDLRKRSGNVMQFYKLAEDAVIPANTPVLYERTEGVSSAVTIEERSSIYDENVATINVPANPKFATVTKTYADAPEPSIQKWQFIGSLEEKTFCGKDCTNPPAGAIRESEDLIYYFKTDNFTRMGDKTWMKLIPYRAYFREVGGAKGGAKISSYSILVVDENGATDITDAILGEGEGDGKIYDLNGIRVMQPVKGRLYIVNGKKKVYE